MGWGGFFDKLISKLPIQNRVERWKNELEDLTQERAYLLITKCDDKKAERVAFIDKRINELNKLLKNKASD